MGGPYLAGSKIPIEVTFDGSGLFVAAVFYNWVTGSPVQVGAPVTMTNFFGNSYGCVFIPVDPGPYTVSKVAYTDDTYVTPNPDEPQGSDAFQVIPVPANTSPTNLIGIIESTQSLVGSIVSDDMLIGEIEED